MSDKDPINVKEMLEKSSDEIAAVIKSLGHPKRLEVVNVLWSEPSAFIDLQNATGLSKTALVHHLDKLVENGIVNRLERGRYELTGDGVELVSASVVAYARSQKRKEDEAARRAEHIQRVHAKRSGPLQDDEVRIVNLKDMKVASVRVISNQPENDAWAKMLAWAEPKALLNDSKKHPVYGFNNPDPKPGKSEYGYEFWMQIYEDMELDEGMEIKKVKGRRYAVITCNLTEELESDYFKEKGHLESWKKIVEWAKASPYGMEKEHCLEYAHDPGKSEGDLILDLYLPITE
ncbi:MAG: effector binding domain-containing protein [Candidatus Thorarchaeota archaeon]|nr:effector binding domain-containing protein [Candidatus Thorarchaeota archaeon]